MITSAEIELLALKAGGAVLGLIVFWWVRIIIRGIKVK